VRKIHLFTVVKVTYKITKRGKRRKKRAKKKEREGVSHEDTRHIFKEWWWQ